jgi:uncharacterized surface protein with fasciclin (FAS1) repeats
LPENKDQLIAILTYHVVPAKVMSSELAGQQANVLTVQGDRVFVDGTGHGVTVDGRMSSPPISKPRTASST